MLERIDVDSLKKLNNIDLIDIRSIQKYNDGHIMNAINIIFNDLMLNPSKYLNKFKKYYIYCQKGNRSLQLCLYLKKLNYNVVNINGGYEAWILDH